MIRPRRSHDAVDHPVLPDDDARSGLPEVTGPALDTRPVTPRSLTLSISMLVTAMLLAVAALLPVPYAISSPGPTRDTLGTHDGEPLIEIGDEVPTYESTGRLLLTTVSVSGGPGYPVTLPSLVRGWLDGSRAVRPVEEVFEPSESREDVAERNQAAMISSQENAAVAALETLGYDVPAVLHVVDTVPGSGAEGVARADDVIVALDGTAVPGFSDLTGMLEEVEPGTEVVLTVERDGAEVDLPIVTTEGPEGQALLGVYIDPEFDMPVDVSIQIDDIGGPSAGMMFALGIIDRMTEVDEAQGQTIAGTGTVDVSGRVGPIGGIRQKLAGALRDGAEWFLVPADNCSEVVGHVPAGLRTVRVATLEEALDAVVAIGEGDTNGLPGCTG